MTLQLRLQLKVYLSIYRSILLCTEAMPLQHGYTADAHRAGCPTTGGTSDAEPGAERGDAGERMRRMRGDLLCIALLLGLGLCYIAMLGHGKAGHQSRALAGSVRGTPTLPGRSVPWLQSQWRERMRIRALDLLAAGSAPACSADLALKALRRHGQEGM